MEFFGCSLNLRDDCWESKSSKQAEQSGRVDFQNCNQLNDKAHAMEEVGDTASLIKVTKLKAIRGIR
jgi:hypothetical protein